MGHLCVVRVETGDSGAQAGKVPGQVQGRRDLEQVKGTMLAPGDCVVGGEGSMERVWGVGATLLGGGAGRRASGSLGLGLVTEV